MSTLFDWSMGAFALATVMIVLARPIHTGFVGSLGLLMMGGGALMATDDSTFQSIENVQEIILFMLAGAALFAIHRLKVWWRTHRAPLNVPHRRRTDFGTLDEGEGPKAGA